jgi:hypothetical protein
VLWRADENGAEPDALMERQPCATNDGTILRMIHLRVTTQKKVGIFQYHGPCQGELFPSHKFDRCFPGFWVVQTDCNHGNQVASMPIMAFFGHPMDGFRQQQSILLDKLQTQNA